MSGLGISYIYFMDALTLHGSYVATVFWQAVFAIGAFALARRLRGSRWLAGIIAYLAVGFLSLGLPMTVAWNTFATADQAHTTWVGTAYLTAIWPIWMWGGWLGFHPLPYTPIWLVERMFS